MVADAVRKRTEKTRQATGEVASVSAIDNGVRKNAAGMDAAATAVDETAKLAENAGRALATASQQQATASEEINRALADISLIAEETAQGMAEAEAELDNLSSSASRLAALIDALRREGQARREREEAPGGRRPLPASVRPAG